MQRNTILGWLGGAVVGAMVGGAAVLAFNMPSSPSGALPALPVPATVLTGKRDPAAPHLEGKSKTSISDFSIEDLDGHKVLRAKEIGAVLDLPALASHTIRMPGGHARSVVVLLRRGKSGRVSLAEALNKREPGQKSENVLAIGPLQIEDARITVAVTERPVVFHIDRATVQVQKKHGDSAPKVFLSDIYGHMADPDPLPQPVRLRGGRGVIDLAGDPLVDLRARVCIGGGEMRVQIDIPERHGAVRLRVDADGFSARTARMALNMVSKSKTRLEVSSGPVEIAENYDCTRAEGRDSRARVTDRANKQPH